MSQGGANPTGSSITNPEGERTGHEDGQYGERPDPVITEDSAKELGRQGYDDKGGTGR